MERQSKGSRDLEAYCKGGQGPLQPVAPPKKIIIIIIIIISLRPCNVVIGIPTVFVVTLGGVRELCT
jgi:hypothetical protein